MKTWEFKSIGKIRTCYPEKFGAPRQPGLVPSARAVFPLSRHLITHIVSGGLSDFSHLWVGYLFHHCLPPHTQSKEASWKPLVRPPRLGGNDKVGVYASRSPFRPNPIGWSVLKIEGVHPEHGTIDVSGVDIVDGAPVVDVKPYLPYADAIKEATGGFAVSAPQGMGKVEYAPPARQKLFSIQESNPEFARVLEETLMQNPAPAYEKDLDREYGMRLFEWNVRWRREGEVFFVLEITENSPD